MSDRIEEIRQRVEVATPGPWREGIPGSFRIYAPDYLGPESGVVAEAAHRTDQFRRRANAAFIAHAPADVRYLLDRIERLEGALRATRCHCVAHRKSSCPQCGGQLRAVSAPGWMNEDQWDAVKAGDYMCNTCEDENTHTGKKYFRYEEMDRVVTKQCLRCAALEDRP